MRRMNDVDAYRTTLPNYRRMKTDSSVDEMLRVIHKSNQVIISMIPRLDEASFVLFSCKVNFIYTYLDLVTM